jgi:hypothetical protein
MDPPPLLACFLAFTLTQSPGFLSGIEDAFSKLLDNDRMRRSRHAQRDEARFSETCP